MLKKISFGLLLSASLSLGCKDAPVTEPDKTGFTAPAAVEAESIQAGSGGGRGTPDAAISNSSTTAEVPN